MITLKCINVTYTVSNCKQNLSIGLALFIETLKG